MHYMTVEPIYVGCACR